MGLLRITIENFKNGCQKLKRMLNRKKLKRKFFHLVIRNGVPTKDKEVGVPRRLFFPGRTERCACVKDSGISLYDPGSKSNNGDLDNPHIKRCEQCRDAKATSCQVSNGSE